MPRGQMDVVGDPLGETLGVVDAHITGKDKDRRQLGRKKREGRGQVAPGMNFVGPISSSRSSR